jgi:glucose/arabinose dehydrogenase
MKIDGNTLFVADIFAFREVDVSTGAVRDIHRMQASDLEYPFAVGLSARQILLSSWFTGSVQVLERAGMTTATMIHGLRAPMDAQFLPDGSIAIAEIATGTITQASGEGFKQRRPIIAALAGPVQMVVGKDGALYVTEAAGNLLRIDVDTGVKTVLADKLALPEGLAFTPWGSIVVAEAAAQRLTEIDLSNGSRRTVADKLPIGLEPGPGLPPPNVVTGVAVHADGTVYVGADRNNAIYKIRPQR